MSKEEALENWHKQLFTTLEELISYWKSNTYDIYSVEIEEHIQELGRITEQIKRWEEHGSE